MMSDFSKCCRRLCRLPRRLFYPFAEFVRQGDRQSGEVALAEIERLRLQVQSMDQRLAVAEARISSSKCFGIHVQEALRRQ